MIQEKYSIMNQLALTLLLLLLIYALMYVLTTDDPGQGPCCASLRVSLAVCPRYETAGVFFAGQKIPLS
jgi:hypothetical protein